jgi:uncharacterized protein YggE
MTRENEPGTIACDGRSARRPGASRLRSRLIAMGSMFLVGSIAAVFLVGGCSSGSDETSRTEAATTGIVAATGAAHTITVQGTGKVSAAPDEAKITLTVENDATEPGAVLDANSQAIQKVLDRLRSEGVEDAAIQTASVSVYPIRTYDPQTGKESLTGYRAQNSVTVALKDEAMVAKILAVSVETGATNVSGPVWRLTEDNAAVVEALKKAAATAQLKAQALAEAQGVKVGQVVMMSEGTVDMPVLPVYMGMAIREEAADTAAISEPPISAGTLDVTATVTITYALVR